MRRTRTAIAALSAVGLGGASLLVLGTTANAKVTTGIATQDIVVASTHSVNESMDGGVYATVVSTSLGRGSWVIAFHASIQDGGGDYHTCHVTAGGAVVASSTAWVGWESSVQETVSNVAGIHLGGPTVVALECGHRSQDGATPSIDSGATLSAHRSAKLRLIYE